MTVSKGSLKKWIVWYPNDALGLLTCSIEYRASMGVSRRFCWFPGGMDFSCKVTSSFLSDAPFFLLHLV